MKRILPSALILVLTLSVAAFARDTKIGIIISSQILEEYPAAVEAQRVLQTEINEWQRQAMEMEEELGALQEELGQQASMFYSEERRAQKQQEFQQKLEEYRRFQTQLEQRAIQRNQELFQPINERVQEVIDQIAAEQGFDIIFDAMAGMIAYLGDPTLDITAQVLAELNRQ